MRRGRDTTTALLGAGAVLAAVFGVGGALRWCQAIVAALVAAAMISTARSRRGSERWSPLSVGLGIAAALTALQLVPLPEGLREALDPVGAQLRADGAHLLGVSPWPALTRDPAGTARGLATLLILLGTAVVALRLAVTERGRYWVQAAVATTCALAALCVGIHSVLGAERLYGLYAPEHAGPHLLGPLLNLNHLGALMVLGAVTSVGLAAYTRQAAWLRAAWVIGAAVMGTVALMTVSRGASLSLGFGMVVVIGTLAIQRMSGEELGRRDRSDFLRRTLPIGVVATCTILVVIYAGATNVGRQLAQTSMHELDAPGSKFAAWRATTALIRESPWVGVGRGAFEASFTRVSPASGVLTFSHVENEYLQAAVDWGVPGALLIAFAGVWLGVVAVRRWKDGPLAAGALAATAALAAQSNVDFGAELLGIAVPAIAIAATLAYVPARELERGPLRRSRAARGALAVALAGAAALLLSRWTTSLDEDHQALQADTSSAQIAEAGARHPLDYYTYAVAAELASHRDDARSVLLLNHALRLSPTHSGLHRLAARLLVRSGFLTQAALEYEAALRTAPNLRPLLAEIAAVFPAALAATAIPANLAAPADLVRTLDELGRERIAREWLARALDAAPPAPRLCDLVFAEAARSHDLTLIGTAGAACVRAGFPPEAPVRLEVSRQLFAEHRMHDAIALVQDVEGWNATADVKREAWFVLCDALAASAPWDEAKRCLRRLDLTGLAAGDHASELARRLDEIDAKHAAAAGSGSTSPPP